MPVEIRIPSAGESITEVTVGTWRVAAGTAVAGDTTLVEIETDKANLEVAAPAAGVLVQQVLASGTVARVGDVVAVFEPGAVGATSAAPPDAPPKAEPVVMPSAARLAAVSGIDTATVAGSGPGGRVLKEDVQRAAKPAAAPAASPPAPVKVMSAGSRQEELVPMTRIRKTIAERLVSAQANAALLTTFNEIDMGPVMALRKRHQESFLAKHGVKLGFMSFFVKACIAALKDVPAVNAEIDGDELVYKNHYDIGIAVGTEKGLVVPVVRDADAMNLAEIEKAIGALGKKARDGQLALDDLQGGTFSITNGGIYGSLMSTPILNAPQSGILGMHAIKDRAMVVGGQVVVRPMMYLALSYDHRVVDGQGAVTFLVKVKEHIEDPQRLLLDI